MNRANETAKDLSDVHSSDVEQQKPQSDTAVSKNDEFCIETRNCVSKTRNFVLKMMNLAGRACGVRELQQAGTEGKEEEEAEASESGSQPEERAEVAGGAGCAGSRQEGATFD